MSSSVLRLARSARQSLFLLTAGAGLSVAAAFSIAGYSSVRAEIPMGEVLSTPGRHFMAEHAVGIRDGLAAMNVDTFWADIRLRPIMEERDPELVSAMMSIYDDGFSGVRQGRYDMDDLEEIIDAIEAPKTELPAHPGLDATDEAILDAFRTNRDMSASLGGEEGGEAMFRLMMMEVAHDQLRDAFGKYTGVPAYGPKADRSLETFLTLTGVLPGIPEDPSQQSLQDVHLTAGVPDEIPGL